MIAPEILLAVTGNPAKWAGPLEVATSAFQIDTRIRQAMFLSQAAHESDGFKHLVENLNYSAAGLLRTWPARFSLQDATNMAMQPVRIAERVYGGRMGNGPEGSGDGYKYRGRGLFQLTGRSNYRDAGCALSADYEGRPELLEAPDDAALTAAWFWSVHGCNELADDGDFTAITRRINGGTNGQPERLAWLDKVNSATA